MPLIAHRAHAAPLRAVCQLLALAPRRRISALAPLALAPLFATSASASQQLPDTSAPIAIEAASAVAPAPIPDPANIAPIDPFAKAFADLGAPPPITIPQGAVDLAAMPPATRGPAVIRSLGTGVASYYGKRFHGRRTANGERFDMNAMTAAHKTLPFGTHVQVTNPSNGRSVTVRINDRGPFIRGRTIDLSRAAASAIGMIARGHARVTMSEVEP